MAKNTKKPVGRKPPAAKPSPRKAAKKLVARKTQSAKPAKANKPRTRAATKPAPVPTPKAKPAKQKTPSTSPGANPLAKRMAAFANQVTKEEEAPVAVRTFNEARAGIERSQELDARTGEVKPVAPQDEEGEDLAEFEEVDQEESDEQPAPPPPQRPVQQGRPAPQMEPLTGKFAVPKRKESEDFQIAPPPAKGKKSAPPTKEDLGRIELRMQRGTTDKTVATASPDYLQRSFKKATQSGKTAAQPAEASERSEDSFEVTADKPERRIDASLTDFGDVEIAQQTRKGKRTLGTLDVDDAKEKQS